MNRLTFRPALAALLVVLLVPGIAGVQAQEQVELKYWLWDTLQLPAYETCAANFEEQNPNINITIEQYGWDDYWTNLVTGFVSGEAPDVFTDQISKFPEFLSLGQVVELTPFVERDGVDMSIYYPQLVELWSKDGKIYGLPKDWDTVAVVYNPQMFEAAGIDPAIMEEWTWNPEDGGTFEEVIAKLTIDANGNNGLSPDFDKENVVQYGYINRTAGSFDGHTEWSHWAVSTGWYYTDGPWSTHYYYDDPRLAATLQWYADLDLVKGYMPSYAEVASLGASALFCSGAGAMTIDGSWMINYYLNDCDFPVAFGRLPIGPEGRRSMFNGLADGIWVGTPHLEEAWQWVKYLASPECLNVVAETAVVFPAIPEAVDTVLEVRAAQGVDISAYTDQAAEAEGLFLYPITDHGSEISAIMKPTMDSIMLGEKPAAEALAEAAAEVNALFE